MRLKLEDVSYVYRRGSPQVQVAVDHVSLEIGTGEFVAVIGATGSGKSTLVQLFNGLLKPQSGRVWVGDTEITAVKTDLRRVRQRVGLVFQYPEHQLFEETVFKDVAYGPINMGFGPRKVERAVRTAIERVGLDYEFIKDRSPFGLSGGQKRRVALAGILAMEPEVLILDEPTAGLDPRGRMQILGEIAGTFRQTGMTVVLITHSMEDAALFADRIMVMAKGKLVIDGPPREVFYQAERLVGYGLDVPEMLKLLLRLKSRGMNIDGTVLTVEEAAEMLAAHFQSHSG